MAVIKLNHVKLVFHLVSAWDSIDSIGAAGRLRRPRSCVQKCRRTCGRGEAGGVGSGWCYKNESIKYSITSCYVKIAIENGYL